MKVSIFVGDVLRHSSLMEGGEDEEDEGGWRASPESSWLDGAVQERGVLKSCGLPAIWTPCSCFSRHHPHPGLCRAIFRVVEAEQSPHRYLLLTCLEIFFIKRNHSIAVDGDWRRNKAHTFYSEHQMDCRHSHTWLDQGVWSCASFDSDSFMTK